MPDNIREPPTLDKVTENTLTLAKRDKVVKRDANYRRAQMKIYEAMGPLARVWALMESLTKDQTIQSLMNTASVSRCLEQGRLCWARHRCRCCTLEGATYWKDSGIPTPR